MTSPVPPAPSEEPPSYSAVSAANPHANLRTTTLPRFVLDGTLVFPSPPPARAAYELSSPPCEAKSGAYEVRKVAYKLTARGGAEGNVRARVDPIYAFRPFRIPLWFSGGRGHVLIDGLGRGQVDGVEMLPGWDSPVGWTVKGFFKVEQRLVDQFRRRGAVSWADRRGRVVAVERRLERGKDGKIVELPGLDVKVELEEKLLDLLVTCWAARLWREALTEGW